MKLVSGTGIAQALAMAATPILTRLYDPTAFGVLSIFAAMTSIVAAVSCLRYEYAIMLPAANREAVNLVAGSVLISGLVALLTAAIVSLGKASILKLLNAPELMPYLWLVAPTVFLGGVSVGHPALNLWVARTRHYGWLSFASIFGKGSTIAYQLIAGSVGFASGGNLILGNVVGGGVVSTLLLGRKVWQQDGRFMQDSWSWTGILQGLRRYARFPLLDTWAALLNAASSHLPIFFLTALFSPAVAGFYALANGLLRLPLNVLGLAIGQVFFQRAGEARAAGTLPHLVETTLSYLVKLSLFPVLLLTIVGEDLFIVALGARWSEAGVYTQILSLWTFFVFISIPLANLFRVLEQQQLSLVLNIVILATRIVSLIVGGLTGDPRLALLAFGVSGVLAYGYYALVVMRHSGVPLERMFKIVLLNALIFLPVGCSLLILKMLGLESWLLVGISLAILGLYLLAAMWGDERTRTYIAGLRSSRRPADR